MLLQFINLSVRSHFEFSFVSVNEVLKEIKKQNPHEVPQSIDVLVKYQKEHADIFTDYITTQSVCRLGFNAQYPLVAMLEKWKGAVDDKKVFGAFLTDLSKAFDCLSHKLIIAKLNAYGFSLPAPKLIYDYFSNRQQRIKINRNFS